MKKTVKRISGILMVIALIALSAFKLYSNKETKAEETKVASITAKAIPVEVSNVENINISKQIESTGVFAPSTDLRLISETQGKITNIYKEKGDKVNKGEIIVKVDDELIQAQVLVAKANFNAFEKDLERFEKLSKDEAITQKQLQDIKVGYQKAKADLTIAKRRLNDTKIKSPVNGIINYDYIELGSVLAPGAPVCEIVNIAKLKISVMVSESEVLHLKPGQSVKILPKVYPGATLEGTINSVGVKAGPGLKYEVEISLNNSKEFPLKAGMFATVNLNGKESRKMLAIDKKAIVGSYYDAHVFVVRNNMAYKQAVTIGQITNNKAEVLAGLDAGMQVVVSGQINLKDGTNINPVN